MIGNEKTIDGIVVDIIKDHGDGFFINKYQIEYYSSSKEIKECSISGLGESLEFKKYYIGDKVKLLKNSFGEVILDKYRMYTYLLIHIFLIILILVSSYRIIQIKKNVNFPH